MCYPSQAQSEICVAVWHGRGPVGRVTLGPKVSPMPGARGFQPRVIRPSGLFHVYSAAIRAKPRGHVRACAEEKRMRCTGSPAQRDFGMGTLTNSLSTYEASDPRNGELEDELPWELTPEQEGLVTASLCP